MDNNYNSEINNLGFTSAAQALRNKFRHQIFSLLAQKNNLSFNDLLKSLNLTRPKLAYHLQILIKYNIIINFYDKRNGVKDHSFYELTDYSKNLLLETRKQFQDNLLNKQIPHSQLLASTSKSSNFRTVRRVEYRSQLNKPVKFTKRSMVPFDPKQDNYLDPLLGCVIKRVNVKSDKPKRVILPTTRQYYILHKNSFIIDNEILPGFKK